MVDVKGKSRKAKEAVRVEQLNAEARRKQSNDDAKQERISVYGRLIADLGCPCKERRGTGCVSFRFSVDGFFSHRELE